MSFQVFQAQGLRIFAGNTATCAGYTGNAGEISVNTETKAVYVHDGLTAGGTPLTTAEQAELLGMTLGQLANVELDAPSDGQVLVYDEDAGVWKNEMVAGAGGGAVELDGLNDVDLTTPADSQVLAYNEATSKWENKEIIAGGGAVVAVKHAVVTGRKDIAQQNCYPYGLTITHTPAKVSNKILLMAYIHHSATYVHSFGFNRDGAAIGHESSNNSNANNSIATNFWGQEPDTSFMLSTSYSYFDSPNSTSELTYDATACSSWNGSIYTLRINDRWTDMRSCSSMVLMEIQP